MKSRSLVIITAVSLLASSSPSAQPPMPLSQPEHALVSSIDAQHAEALALLERAVNINSGTQNFEGVKAVGALFRRELDALGFRTRWVEGAAFKRAGHVVAERPGPGRKVLLIGHLDTVFEKDSPFQKFERIDERSARGPGIIDMKGGDVIIIHALKALNAAGVLDNMNVTVVMTGDEEDAGDPQARARAALVAAAKGADVAIGFEDGDGDPKTAVIARRGTASWQLRVTGRPAHSSQIFRSDIGPGAIFEAARVLNAFRERMAGEDHLTFNPGIIVGGTTIELDAAQARASAFGKTNVIAEHALVSGDLRTLSPEQLERTQKTMQQVVATTLPHTQATLTFEEGYPSLPPADGNTRLLAMYDRASQDLGFGPVTAVDPNMAGAADVSFVASEVTMILDGVGLMGRDGHTVNETADLTTLPSQTKRAAVLLYRLAHRAETGR
jgi:glutamate carboxypeptidase